MGFRSHFQIINRSLQNGSSGNTFLDKLITVSQQNKNFTLQDIKVEAHTLLIGVRTISLLHLYGHCILPSAHQQWANFTRT